MLQPPAQICHQERWSRSWTRGGCWLVRGEDRVLLLSEYALTIVVEDANREYEPAVPDRQFPAVINHPDTQKLTLSCASEPGGGLLRESGSTGYRLPPQHHTCRLCCSGSIEALIRQDPRWDTYWTGMINVLQSVVKVHAAVLWDTQHSYEMQLVITVPGSRLPLSIFYESDPIPARSHSPLPPLLRQLRESGLMRHLRHLIVLSYR